MNVGNKNLRNSIVLIGLRGAGKTTVGRALAKLLSCAHADTDELIVAANGQSIFEIFRDQGEPAFREQERQSIAQLVRNPPGVISVGGGAILDPVNVSALRAIGQLVWLTAPPSVLWKRIQDDPRTASDRPELTNCGGRAGMAKLLIEREPLYRAAAHYIIDTADKTPEFVAREVADLFRTPSASEGQNPER